MLYCAVTRTDIISDYRQIRQVTDILGEGESN